ncbi:MAG: transglycosylase SLT domain-containing protein [Gemmatimonadaceae bacterium]|nr:transglycosylase SLT domain-containing protein [Gemmatimonadaceae bacterium]
MHDPVHKEVNTDAMQRHRRMLRRRAQRQAKRQMTRVAIAITVVAAAYGMLGSPSPATDDATTHSATALADSAGHGLLGFGATRPRSLKLDPTPSFADQPLWRRAGDVLRRGKAGTQPTLALASGQREQEHHETLSRWHAIYSYSTRYRIKTELARKIYDAATVAGIEPELAFRVVRVESVFNPKAVSPVGALGLTQLMLGTARAFEPNVTRQELLDPDVNLRIGFRYLRGLIREYKGDLKLALLVYNRGPVAVQRSLAMGMSPANGYESIITRGYRGRGTLD